MTLDWDLFLGLCQKYEVQFSSEYDAVMLKDNGHIEKLSENDIERLIVPPNEVISYTVDLYDNIDIPPKCLKPNCLLSDKFFLMAA